MNVCKNGHFLNSHTQSICWRNIWMVPYSIFFLMKIPSSGRLISKTYKFWFSFLLEQYKISHGQIYDYFCIDDWHSYINSSRYTIFHIYLHRYFCWKPWYGLNHISWVPSMPWHHILSWEWNNNNNKKFEFLDWNLANW